MLILSYFPAVVRKKGKAIKPDKKSFFRQKFRGSESTQELREIIH